VTILRRYGSIAAVAATAFVITSLAACVSRGPAPAGDAEAEVAGAERAFAEAAAREGVRDAFVRFASDSAVAFGPEPEKAREAWRRRPPLSIRLSWYPVYVRAAASGDLGFTTGPYESRDSTGALTGTGTYFTVWRREPDGWRFVVDQGIRNPPPATPPAPWTRAAMHPAAPAVAADANAATSLLAADSAFAAEAHASGFAAALQRFGDREVRLMRNGAPPHVGIATAVAAAAADSARRYSAVPMRGFASAAGDLGWTWGEYRLVHPGAGRRETGHYVHVWIRDGRGPWRLLVDVTAPRPPERDE
jgi:ketosteroid isomerase-like protein